jgi:hypothetical protein
MNRDTRRLPERFPLHALVEVQLPLRDGSRWVPAVVVAHAAPAVWVRTRDGRRWFVTNGSRLREPVP